jgi:HEPN domain-containing protein
MDKLDYALEWLNFAEMDLSSAEFLLGKRPIPIEIICYLCQQSTEKSLKGFLISKRAQPPKTHDLVELCKLCSPFITDMSSILNKCLSLNPYGVQPRYPREISITEQDMKQAIENAKTIKDFILPLVRPSLNTETKKS